jgi:isoquinoline 1-oxidoreductase alpha subunit
MIMAVSSFLASNPQPTDEEIDAGITNICRCGTYERIRTAIHEVAGSTAFIDASQDKSEVEKDHA